MEADEIVVVDNGSADATAAVAQARPIRWIANGANLGYGRACNIGARASAGDLLLFLNPDAVFAPGAIEALRRASALYPEAAAFGPAILGADGRADFQDATIIETRRERRPAASALPNGPCCVSFLSGAALMCRREAFEAAGGFDENIFLYYEDDDLCHRLRLTGRPLIYEPAARVRHLKGTSSRPSLATDYRRHLRLARSRLYVCRKYGLPDEAPILARRSAIRALRSILGLNLRKALRHAGMLHGYAAAWMAAAGRRRAHQKI